MSKTSEYLDSLTEQEVFDRVVSHLRKQKIQSWDGEVCRYRHNGLMCAAGCLIDDEDYNESMEDSSWRDIACGLGCIKHSELIRSLQSVHDWYLHTMESALKRVADEFNLEYHPPNNEEENCVEQNI